MVNDLSAFSDRPPAPAPVPHPNFGPTPAAKSEPAAPVPAANPEPAPDHVPVLVPDTQPGTHQPEQPGKEVSADAHDEEHVPIIGFVDHQVPAIGGGLINVHTPGVILTKQPK